MTGKLCIILAITCSSNDLLRPVSFTLPNHPPPLSHFLYLIPNLRQEIAHHCTDSRNDSIILHTQPSSRLLLGADGTIIFRPGKNSNELFLRNLPVDLIPPLFSLISHADSNKGENYALWNLIPHKTSDSERFISLLCGNTLHLLPLTASHPTTSSAKFRGEDLMKHFEDTELVAFISGS